MFVFAVSVGVGILSLVITLGLWYMDSRTVENQSLIIRMATSAADNRASFQSADHTAFVVGYTGEVGKELVKELLTSNVFKHVVLIGRREVKYEDELYKDVEQKVVEFDRLEEFADVFQGHDIGFCCLGTTRGKSGADGFYKVDHDYVVATAKLAKAGGTSHFNLVSSQGANQNSSFLYPKTKGEVEEELKKMEFNRLSIYRPGVLMCDRQESRFGEKIARQLLKPIAAVFPTSITTPTTTVAKALVNCAVSPPPTDKKWELFENKAIHQLAGEIDSDGKKIK